MAYGSTDGVEALLPAMGRLSTSSVPKLAQVTQWLVEGSSVIDRTLAGAGYTVPVLVTATVYGELTGLANLYGAAHAAMARSLDVISGSDENRAQTWLNMFYDRLTMLAASTLADVPTTSGSTATGRRVRFTQLKRVDGYSAPHDDDTEMDQ